MENLLVAKKSADYELLDSGAGEKLERYGNVVVARPDPQALWPKLLSPSRWSEADAIFGIADRSWRFRKKLPEPWTIKIDDLNFQLKPTSFKHVGIFPENAPHWNWIEETIKKSGRKISALNLFGYTGGATLAASYAGASVVHVDASKPSVEWAKENAALSDLADAPIRYILDDAHAFVKREARRENKYDAVILDPPAFGRGPKGELWKIESDLPKLLEAIKNILSEKPLFILINGYAAGYSPLAYRNLLLPFEKLGCSVTCGEVAIEESGFPRLLPAGICGRWNIN